MRILLVSRELVGFYGGGIGTYVGEMSRLLAARGHQVHLLTAAHDGMRDRARKELPGVHLHQVELERGDAALDAYPTYPMRYAMAVFERVKELSAAEAFDYVEFPDYHAEGYFCIRAKRTLGMFDASVLAVRLHSSSSLCREADGETRLDVELATIEHMEREAIAGADIVIAPGEKVLTRSMPADCRGVQRRAVVPIPIDSDALVRAFGGPKADYSGPPTVLFFGKLQHLKGVQDLVTAGQLLLDRGVPARFRLIGNDSTTGPFGRSMLEHLRRRIAPQHAASFTFEPALPREELGGAIRGAAICCFPSRWEAFPMVCLEAMALGAPVVASDAGGLSEIIRDNECGRLFPAGDIEALASRLHEVLTDQSLRARLGASGAQRVRSLCAPVAVLDRLEEVIAETKQVARPLSPRTARSLVSIIIPHYNLGAYLDETVASALAQTHGEVEIIVIDDGSTEPESIAALDRLPQAVRLIRKPNGGLGSTRNAGLREARGDWIMPLDADDLIDPTLVQKSLAAVERDPNVAYVSPLVRYFPDHGVEIEREGGWIPLGLERDLLPVINVGGAASGSLIRREIALRVGGWDETMPAYEDWEFWCRLADLGVRGTIIPEFLLRYRIRANSMFRTELSRHLALHSYIIEKHPSLINARTARILASRTTTSEARAEAQRLIDENVRYRIADRVNEALKRAGVHRAVKGVAAKVLREH